MGLVSHTIGAPGKQLPGAAMTGRSHSARPSGAGPEFGSADPMRRLMGAPLSTQIQPVCSSHHNSPPPLTEHLELSAYRASDLRFKLLRVNGGGEPASE